MKIQIRRGVFETNSSSTHSLQITKGGVEEAKADIIKNMFSTREKEYRSQIEGNKITITGLECKTGGEDSDVYTIITGWEAKLQYLAAELIGIYEDEGDEVLENVKNIFSKCVIDIAAKHGVTINEVIYDITYTNWPEETYSAINLDTDPQVEEDIEKYVNTLMDDSIVLTFGSEAYSCYEGREIYIIK